MMVSRVILILMLMISPHCVANAKKTRRTPRWSTGHELQWIYVNENHQWNPHVLEIFSKPGIIQVCMLTQIDSLTIYPTLEGVVREEIRSGDGLARLFDMMYSRRCIYTELITVESFHSATIERGNKLLWLVTKGSPRNLPICLKPRKPFCLSQKKPNTIAPS